MMAAFTYGFTLAIGLTIGATATYLLMQRRSCPEPDAHELGDDDRALIAEQFKVHTQAVREQVSTFADTLAGDDTLLRERLRLFETGEQ